MDKIIEYANSLTNKYFAELLDEKEDELTFTAKVDQIQLMEHLELFNRYLLVKSKHLINNDIEYKNNKIDTNTCGENYNDIKYTFQDFVIETSYLELYPFVEKIMHKATYTDRYYVFSYTSNITYKTNKRYWFLLIEKYFNMKFSEWKLLYSKLSKLLTPHNTELAMIYIFRDHQIYKLLENDKNYEFIDILLHNFC
jgi:hypothetical protein